MKKKTRLGLINHQETTGGESKRAWELIKRVNSYSRKTGIADHPLSQSSE